MRREGQWRLIVDAVALGVVGALSAQVFIWMLKGTQAFFLTWLAGYQPPGLTSEGGVLQEVIGSHGLWLIPLATTVGGLLSGILVYSFAPEAEGHGTDSAVKAFHGAGGFIRARVAPVKMVASAITIGSGGAAGREGPIALIGAGIGSLFATLTHRSDEERRLLVLVAMAAGLSAIFRSPIGTAIFAVEVLYRDMDFDADALLYTLLGSVIAYDVNGLFVGWQPLFVVPPRLAVPEFLDYLWFVLLGIVAGPVATLLPMMFYRIRDAFHALPGPPHIKPAIGGLGIGLLALALPQVLGGGYGWIQEAIDGRLAAVLLLDLVFAKLIAFALTVSSGGSGGVFAPSLFVGAMLGGLVADLLHQPPAAFVIVGMAAVFGPAARVPIATLLMVAEMTGGYRLLGAAALAITLSYVIQVTLSTRLEYKSLYEAQVPGRADSPAHHREQVEAAIHLLGQRESALLDMTSHLDLRALLESGIPVDLPDGKQLHIGGLTSKSPYVGRSIESCVPADRREDLEVVAVFRQGRTLLPHRNLTVQAGDRLLLIASPHTWRQLASDFTSPSQ